MVSISTVFHAQWIFAGSTPDTILISSDSVLFYVHSHHLLQSSGNAFGSLLSKVHSSIAGSSSSNYITVRENADLLNVVVHAFYGMDSQKFNPPPEVMLESIVCLKKYGARLEQTIAPSTPLFDHLVMQAPRRPLDFYVTAAAHNLHSLAAQVSAYLLSFPLTSITDEQAEKMGAIYLKKLYALHHSRIETLRKLLLSPPEEHPANVDCGFVDQKRVTRAWALAAAQMVWEKLPGKLFSLFFIQTTLGSLTTHVTCNTCKEILNAKIRQIIVEWSLETVSFKFTSDM
ncbi:hypothetical protein C8Q75DRAFT_716605 [Abortiporus biennis]|nr:hypothetical protein C8Q75DRAFT_716605 [Abortiporus biennis]